MEGKRSRGKKGWDGWMESLNQWTWVWANSRIVKDREAWCATYKCRSISVQFSRSVVSDSLRPHESQHARPPSPSPTPGVYLNSCPLYQWCHPNISSSVVLFSSCPQSSPASGSFQINQFFTSGGHRPGASASLSVPPINVQDWFSLGLTGLISLLSKKLSRIFSSTTIRKHQFFGVQPSSWSNPHTEEDLE